MDDQAALALADRSREVDDPRGHGAGLALETEAVVRVDRRQVLEVPAAARLFRRFAVDAVDLQQRRVLLGLLRRAHLALDHVAAAKLEAADLRHGRVHVLVAGQVARGADEAVALVKNVEDAHHVDEALGFHLGLEDGLDQLVLLLQKLDVEVELGRHLLELAHRLAGELFSGDRRYLLLLLVAAGTSAAAAASLAWTCAHRFLTFSQSARKDSRPRSVRGCFTRLPSTANGTVAISAPRSADCVTWFAERIEAAMTSTGCPKS